MAKIELNELMAAANEVIAENQKDYSAQDNERALVYTLAYNDGVLDFVNKLQKTFFFLDSFGIKIEEADSDKG